jgi:hypothetical protein
MADLSTPSHTFENIDEKSSSAHALAITSTISPTFTPTATVVESVKDEGAKEQQQVVEVAGRDLTLESSRYLYGRQLVLVVFGILMTVFLVALDQSIVATAIPRIASQFHGLERISWIVSAYFCESPVSGFHMDSCMCP